MKRHFREVSVAATLGLLLMVLAIFAPTFYQTQPLLSLAARQAPILIVTCGIALVIICREIDISIGSQFSICSIVGALLAAMHWPLALVVAAAIGTGALLGAFNGLFIAGLGLPSIVVTLATMVAWRESLGWVRQGLWVDLPDGVQWFGLRQAAGQWAIILTALVALVLGALASKHLAAGRFVYAVGSDSEAARLAGISPRRVKFSVFVLMGALAGLAAMLNMAQSPQVDPNSGNGLELKTIAAAVIGGVAISGGRGTLAGAFLGLLLLGCINPALTHLRIEAYWEKAIQGAIILFAVVADGWRNRGKVA